MTDTPTDRIVRDPARLAAVRRTALLDTPPEETFDRLTRLAARLVGAPATFISLVDEVRDFYKSSFGFGEPLASAREMEGLTFCHFAVAGDAPLAIDDTHADPVFRAVPTVESLGVRAYLGIPLVTTGGQAIGSFCAIDLQPRQWSAAEREILAELAASAMREIELRTLARDADRERREKAALLESTGEGIYGIDMEGRCTFLNRAGAEMIGWAPEECLGREMHALIHHHRPDGTPYPAEECPINRAGRESRGVRVTGEVLWRRDGSSFPAEYSSFPLRDDGEIRGVVVTFQDVTERMEAEAARDRALAELERTLQARSRFYAGMGHELRTPINAILGYGDLLLEGAYGPMSESQETAVGRALRAARQLLELVNDVLDLSRLEAGRVDLELEEVSLVSLLLDAIGTVAPLAEAHGYRVTLDRESCSDPVRTDPQRVRQIVLNLLSNAVKFGEGKPIEVRCRAASGGMLAVEVTDHGRGIAADDLHRVWDDFVQLAGARSNATGQTGTGLGLPISRRLARALGGDLQVESAPGEGSTFRLVLPA